VRTLLVFLARAFQGKRLRAFESNRVERKAACKKFRAKNQRIILRKSECFAPDVVSAIESELVPPIPGRAFGIGRISRAFEPAGGRIFTYIST